MLALLLLACVLALVASVVFTWASGKSPLWNIGFGVVLVVASAAVLLVIIVLAMRQYAE